MRSTAAIRHYLRYLCDTRTELAIVLASLLLVLVLAEPLTMVALGRFAPDWGAHLMDIHRDQRRWLLGGPPALAAFAAWVRVTWRRAFDGSRASLDGPGHDDSRP